MCNAICYSPIIMHLVSQVYTGFAKCICFNMRSVHKAMVYNAITVVKACSYSRAKYYL